MKFKLSVACLVICLLPVGLAESAHAAPPVTTPTVTAPTDAQAVAGVVTLTASSTASTVQFFVSGNPLGNPVAVSDGTASTPWETWGFDPNASFAITAKDCESVECGSASAAVTVTLDNVAPTVTAPTASQQVGSTTEISATAPGGAVEFFVDDVSVGTDLTAPYTKTVEDLADGPHTTRVRNCDSLGTTCIGEQSGSTAFTVASLHPTVFSVSPSPFSPNGDGRRDSTTSTFVLERTQAVTWRVMDLSESTTIRGPIFLGTLNTGTHQKGWLGLNNSSAAVPGGTYRIVITTSQVVDGATLTGRSSRDVVLDRTAPSLCCGTATGSTFYPVADGYKDVFRPKVTVGSGARIIRRFVRDTTGRVLTKARGVPGAGTYEMSWDGRDAAGNRLPAGTYRYGFSVEDAAGNRRTTGYAYTVKSSAKRLVWKAHSVTVGPKASFRSMLNGDCSAAASPYRDDWPGSIYLMSDYYYPDCAFYEDASSLASTLHTYTLPAAHGYSSVRVDAYSGSKYPGNAAALIYFTRHDELSSASLRLGATFMWRNGPTVSAGSYLINGRTMKWMAGTTGGSWHAIKSFRVTWSARELH